MPALDDLYGPVDNLAGLLHPAWHRSFEYMSTRRALQLASAIAERIIASGRKLVVVSETGASPLAELIVRVAAARGTEIKLVPVKFPRRPALSDIYDILSGFMPEDDPGRGALRQLCSNLAEGHFDNSPADVESLLDSLIPGAVVPDTLFTSFQRGAAAIFKNTATGKLFSQPFVYLDEYIDSGTTLRNALAFFRCFTVAPDLVTASYYVRPSRAADHERVLYLQATEKDRPGCFEEGAYPYENRVDLIGHFYCIGKGRYERVEVAGLAGDSTAGGAHRGNKNDQDDEEESLLEAFVISLTSALAERAQEAQFLERFKEEQVRRMISVRHLVRYALWALETRLGSAVLAEFLFQLFDMYGPAWTPMPVAFHFDFWNGFGIASEGLAALAPEAIVPELSRSRFNFAAEYTRVRPTLIRRAARLCEMRRKAWLREVEECMEVCYG